MTTYERLQAHEKAREETELPAVLKTIEIICRQRGIDMDSWSDANYGRPTFELRPAELRHMLRCLPKAKPAPERYEYMLEKLAEEEVAIPAPPKRTPLVFGKNLAPQPVEEKAAKPEGSLLEDLGLDLRS